MNALPAGKLGTLKAQPRAWARYLQAKRRKRAAALVQEPDPEDGSTNTQRETNDPTWDTNE